VIYPRLTRFAFAAVLAAALSPSPARAADRVETLDARLIEGEVVSVTADQVVIKTAQGRQTLSRGDICEIVFSEPPDVMDKRNQGVVVTHGGDRIACGPLSLENGKFSFSSPLLGPIQMDITAVRIVYPASAKLSPGQIEQKCAELRITDSTQDTLVVAQKEDAWLGVEGVLKGIDLKDGKVAFRWQDEDKKVALNIVMAMRLAATSGKPAEGAGVVLGKDGTIVGFTALTADDKTVTATLSAVGERKLNRETVAGLRFRPQNYVNLADLKPSAVKEYGFFQETTRFPYRPNKSAAGGDLRLGGRVYRTGLGTHSFCELTYSLDGAYSTFVATVGIDDAVRPLGDATVTFLADGKSLGQPVRATGRSEPTPVRLDLKGVKQFTVRVDFSKDALGVGDHVDIVAARLLK